MGLFDRISNLFNRNNVNQQQIEYPDTLKYFEQLNHVNQEPNFKSFADDSNIISANSNNIGNILRKVNTNSFELYEKDNIVYIGFVENDNGKYQTKFLPVTDEKFIKEYSEYIALSLNTSQVEAKFNSGKVVNYFRDCALQEIKEDNPEFYQRAIASAYREIKTFDTPDSIDRYREKVVRAVNNIDREDFTTYYDKLTYFYDSQNVRKQLSNPENVVSYLTFSVNSYCTVNDLTKNNESYIRFYKNEEELKTVGQDSQNGRRPYDFNRDSKVYEDYKDGSGFSFGNIDCTFKYFMQPDYGSNLAVLDLKNSELENQKYYKADYEITTSKLCIERRLDLSNPEDVCELVTRMNKDAFFSFLDDKNINSDVERCYYGSFQNTMSRLQEMNNETGGKYEATIKLFETIKEIRMEELKDNSNTLYSQWENISAGKLQKICEAKQEELKEEKSEETKKEIKNANISIDGQTPISLDM